VKNSETDRQQEFWENSQYFPLANQVSKMGFLM